MHSHAPWMVSFSELRSRFTNFSVFCVLGPHKQDALCVQYLRDEKEPRKEVRRDLK